MKLLSRNKKAADETQPKDQAKGQVHLTSRDDAAPYDADKNKPKIQGYGTQPKQGQKKKEKRGFFGRKKKEKKQGFLLPSEKVALTSTQEVVAPDPPMSEVKPDEPERQVSEEKEEAHRGRAPLLFAQPNQDQPVVPVTVYSNSNEGEDEQTSQSAEKPPPPSAADTEEAPEDRSEDAEEPPREEKEEKERLREPEGRNEEAEGESAEKHVASLTREGTDERTDTSKMSIEEPHEESTGLLCGCI